MLCLYEIVQAHRKFMNKLFSSTQSVLSGGRYAAAQTTGAAGEIPATAAICYLGIGEL